MRRKGMPMKKQAKVSEKDFDEELSVSESRMNRKAARKKRILRNRLLFLGVILLIVGAILFRFLVVARTVNVTNETPYSDEQLLASMKEGEGSFLFSFSADKITEELKTAYPYVGSVEVKKHFPTSVDITFRRAERAYAFAVDGKYVFTDEDFKVLEISSVGDSGILTVCGADIGEYSVGKELDTQAFGYGGFIKDALAQTERTGIGRITKIDLTKKYRIMCLLNDTVTVIVGDFADLDKKFDTLKNILDMNDADVPATVNVKNYARGTYSLGSEMTNENSSSQNAPGDSNKQDTDASYDTDIEPEE